jgi:hypothetical protein
MTINSGMAGKYNSIDGKSENLDWWYDKQIRRYLTQLIRIFSHFRVREYTEKGVNYNRVPCRYADSSRMVTHIMRNNSENIINSCPFISVSIQSLKYQQSRTQDPFNVDTVQVAEREYDHQNNVYGEGPGNLYTVHRYMPVPYDLTINVDIWSPNTDTKLQIMEQLMVIFNPSIQIQSTNNPLDWSSIFEVTLTDVNWSNRTVPAGVDEIIDIATMTFDVPIWINPPAQVKRQQIIQTIVTNIFSDTDDDIYGFDSQFYDFFRTVPETPEQLIITPNDYRLKVEGSEVQLLTRDYKPAIWSDLLEVQGGLLTDTSLLKVNTSDDIDNELAMIVGSVKEHPFEPSKLIWNIAADTQPSDTLTPVTRIVNPDDASPGDGLPFAAMGQRYLITAETPQGENYWGNANIIASPNDIIEYTGSWEVAFDSSVSGQAEVVTNNYTNKQLKWDGEKWLSAYEGVYNGGFWRLYP